MGEKNRKPVSWAPGWASLSIIQLPKRNFIIQATDKIQKGNFTHHNAASSETFVRFLTPSTEVLERRWPIKAGHGSFFLHHFQFINHNHRFVRSYRSIDHAVEKVSSREPKKQEQGSVNTPRINRQGWRIGYTFEWKSHTLNIEHWTLNILLSLLMFSLQFIVPDIRLPGLLVRPLFL
jgi:hypothetical protein